MKQVIQMNKAKRRKELRATLKDVESKMDVCSDPLELDRLIHRQNQILLTLEGLK